MTPDQENELLDDVEAAEILSRRTLTRAAINVDLLMEDPAVAETDARFINAVSLQAVALRQAFLMKNLKDRIRKAICGG